jgi:hypothetical protein
MTGCQFAALIAQDPKRIFAVSFHELASEANVSRVFEAAAQAHLPAVAVFTGIRTEADLVEQLCILARGSRWTITREYPAGLVTDDVLIGIHWQIRDGLSSSIMGLAPFATMPVTRRAPYVCLAAWPGGHDNPHWTRYEHDIVHFLDTDLSALQLTPTKYRSLAGRPAQAAGRGAWPLRRGRAPRDPARGAAAAGRDELEGPPAGDAGRRRR